MSIFYWIACIVLKLYAKTNLMMTDYSLSKHQNLEFILCFGIPMSCLVLSNLLPDPDESSPNDGINYSRKGFDCSPEYDDMIQEWLLV